MKLFGAAFALVLAFSGLAAASALAGPQFYLSEAGTNETTIKETEPLEGSLIGTTKEGTYTGEVHSVLTTTILGNAIELTGTAAVITGSIDNKAEGGTRGHATGVQVHFTNVSVIKPKKASCTVSSVEPGGGVAAAGTITTRKLTGLAVPAEGTKPLGVELTPETAGEPFTKLKFGAECGAVANVEVNVTGTARGKSVGDVLEFSTETGSNLKVGENAATFSGNFTLTSTGKTVTVK
jgi:hypothetical protein